MCFKQILINYLNKIKDCRHPSYVKHKLADVLCMMIYAVFCGNDTLCDIFTYIKDNEEMLQQEFKIKSIPSKSTLWRILRQPNSEEIRDIIFNIIKFCMKLKFGNHWAADGKAMRGSTGGNVMTLCMYDTATHSPLAASTIYEKISEMVALREIIKSMDLNGIVITGDALHCQKETCKIITQQGGDYVFSLKGNQPTLHNAAKEYFEDPETEGDWEMHEGPTEKAHGRIEKRTCYKLTNSEWLKDMFNDWPGLATIFAIRTYREQSGQDPEETVSYFITSLDKTPKELMQIKRDHWLIESNHWSLDKILGEDHCKMQSKDANIIMNSMRRLSIWFHEKIVKLMNDLQLNIKESMKRGERNIGYLKEILSTEF